MENTTTDTAAFPDAIQDETLAPASSPPPNILPEDIYDELVECELTEADKAHKREQLERVDREIIRLEEEKKAEAKAKNNLLKPLKAERESILDTLNSGVEKRNVPCYEVVDERLGKVEVRRCDNNELVEERALSLQEREEAAQKRQGSLPFDGAPAEDDGDDESEEDDEDFEPEPEAIAQAAEDEGRIQRTTSAEVRARKAKRQQAEGHDAE